MAIAQETILEIDLGKLKHNFEFIKSKIKPKTKFLAVVKAFAYGSDAETIAQYLQKLDVDYFAVAYVHEGIQLRKAGIHKPILVLHPQTTNFKHLIEHCLEPSLYNFRVLLDFISVATTFKHHNYPIHIKFNTGLNRLGFSQEDIEKITEHTNTSGAVNVTSIFSHLAASEDLNEKKFTKNQINLFDDIKTKFEHFSSDTPFSHLTNTSGILNFPEAHYDMVRAGIGLYGFGNSESHSKYLQPIAALKSIISQIHTIEKGESLGYNRGFIAKNTIRTATIPIGHADGISRQYGNGKGYVFINNQKASILGNVCMDMIMIDVTHIECKEADEVIIFNETHKASNIAQAVNTISYEIITSISHRIKRIFINE
ncbi:alanine racemase [Flavobacteriaceae bacterium]|nr:alanine racemase [Flavobacteriaceae bacterium]